MDELQKDVYIENMVDNLPTLRTKLGISQEGLAELIGVSRSTIATIERRKKKMTWNMFLSLVLVFTKNCETDKLLDVMGIYTDEFNEYIKNRSGGKGTDKV